jgi:mannose-6-phosphate isomerase-like protein (cupin superfamily)
MSYFNILHLPTFLDSRGALTVLDGALPFDIKRIYWICGADGKVRGGHRHVKARQALVAINGTVSIYMNDGRVSETVVLKDPGHCLLVEPKDWHRMFFSPGSVLLVISSEPYDRSDYIDDAYK